MVTGRLLPPPAADLLHLGDRSIPNARPWSPSRHTCRLVWWHHDGRAPCRGGSVECDRVVGRVSRDACDVAVERRDQANAGRRVISSRLSQPVGHDHARPVDAEMELLPAPLAATRCSSTSRCRLRRDSVVWSGASRSTSIKERTDRKKPSAWRKGNRKTSRSVSVVSMARSSGSAIAYGDHAHGRRIT